MRPDGGLTAPPAVGETARETAIRLLQQLLTDWDTPTRTSAAEVIDAILAAVRAERDQ